MVLENYTMLHEILQELQQEYVEVKEQARYNPELISRENDLHSKVTRLETIFKEETERNRLFFHIQEDERNRISRDLHDTSLQNLSHLIHKIELSSMYIDKDPLRAKLELSVINKNLKTIIEEIRNTIFNLRPMEFDDLGLSAAFERLINIINADRRYDIDFYAEDVSCENSLILFNLYRTVQECLVNIVEHADASKIFFHAKYDKEAYHIIIQDNGKGFTPEDIEEKKKNHFGMSLMKDRIRIVNGELNVSTDKNGTKIEIKIPLEELSGEQR